MVLQINQVLYLVVAQVDKSKNSLSYEKVIAEVEKNLNVEELQAKLTIEFTKKSSKKTWQADLYSWNKEGANWKAAKFFGDREDGTIIKRKADQFSQKNSSMPYFDLGEGAADVGIFGTDYSFRDVLEFTKLASDYNKVVFEDKGDSYHIVMEAKPGKKPFYYKRELWVDKEKLYPRRMKVFGSTGGLIKTIEINKTDKFSGANFPVEILVESATRATTTKIILENLKSVSKTKVREFTE